jgi:hypothetical protein
MGYLDSTSITVDAVLTKKGRQLISGGGQLSVNFFSLSDTGVDYNLWNPDHTSGSAYYGEAIEDLPMVEATVHSQYSTRNRLVSLSRNTTAMPALELTPSAAHTFNTAASLPVTINVLGFTSPTGMTGASGMQLLVPDVNIVTSNGTAYDITGNALSFIHESDIPNARLYEVSGTGPYNFDIIPATNLTDIGDGTGGTVNLTFIHIATGAYATLQVTVDDNLQPQSRMQSGAGTGPA